MIRSAIDEFFRIDLKKSKISNSYRK